MKVACGPHATTAARIRSNFFGESGLFFFSYTFEGRSLEHTAAQKTTVRVCTLAHYRMYATLAARSRLAHDQRHRQEAQLKRKAEQRVAPRDMHDAMVTTGSLRLGLGLGLG